MEDPQEVFVGEHWNFETDLTEKGFKKSKYTTPKKNQKKISTSQIQIGSSR